MMVGLVNQLTESMGLIFMRDLEVWMWSEACELLDKADRLHRQFFRPAVMDARRPTWEPPADIYETDSELIVTIALPGVAPEHVVARLENGQLLVTGQRRLPTSAELQIRRLEIP
ncbi:MAG: Hsp20/alpha crystallin family protein, partial [Methylovulum sp.]|nr:Hsp20/alpha crystallin family protein [Methylovulum sp.]